MPTLSLKACTVQVEKWADAIPEMRTLFHAHFRELGVNKHRLTPRCDEARYAELERLGLLLLLTVRAEGNLVGYFLGFVMANAHYAYSGPWALTDMYFILPEFRKGAGLKLFRKFKAVARERGCKFAVTSCKVHQDHTAFLEKLGAKWTDKTFIFALEDDACR